MNDSVTKVTITKLDHAFRIPIVLIAIFSLVLTVLAFSSVATTFIWVIVGIIFILVVSTVVAFWYAVLKNVSLLRSEEHLVEMQRLGSNNPTSNAMVTVNNAIAIEAELTSGTRALPSTKNDET